MKFYIFFKRLFDFLVSIFFLTIFFPLYLLLILILLFTGEHQVFYLQERIGYNNNKFKIYKFATMVKNSSKIGLKEITVRNDPRILPFGKFLRYSKLNELPQIFNVLIGKMSFVGPRPLMEVSFNRYNEIVKKNIYKSKPGITGIGSLVFRDEEKLISNLDKNSRSKIISEISDYKGKVELWYYDNSSITTDLKILLLTFIKLFISKNYSVKNMFNNLPKGLDKFE